MGDAPAGSPEFQLHFVFEGSSLRTEKDVEGLELQLFMGVGRRLPAPASSFKPGQASLIFSTTDPQGFFAEILRSLTPDLRALLRHAFFLNASDKAATTILWRDGAPAFRQV